MRVGPFGIWELLIILAVVLVIFGPSRLPAMAKGLGRSVREFRNGIRDLRGDVEAAGSEESRPSTRSHADSGEAPVRQPERVGADPKS